MSGKRWSRSVLVVVAMMLLAQSAPAAQASTAAPGAQFGEWTQLQGGPHRTGVARDAALTQSTLNRLSVAWTTPMSSTNYVPPVIVGGAVYEAGAVDWYSVTAYDLQTGVPRWNAELPGLAIGKSLAVSNGILIA